MLIEHPAALGHGREIFNDGIARSAELGPDLYAIEAGGRSVQFDLMSVAEAVSALCRSVGGCSMMIVEAGRALVDDAMADLGAEG